MAEIPVAVLDVDEVEAKLCSNARGTMKIIDDGLDFAVGEQGKIGREIEFAVEDGMAVENFRLGFVVYVGAAVAAGMGELQADEKARVGTANALVLLDER